MNKKRIWEIFRFLLVGGISFVIDYGTLYALTEYFNINYLYSSAIAFTISVIMNYWLCIVYVFKDIKQQSLKQQSLFIGSSVVGLGLNQLCMYFFVEILGVYYMLAKIVATALVTLWNYVMKRRAIVG